MEAGEEGLAVTGGLPTQMCRVRESTDQWTESGVASLAFHL
jgi:hypothetical protein